MRESDGAKKLHTIEDTAGCNLVAPHPSLAVAAGEDLVVAAVAVERLDVLLRHEYARVRVRDRHRVSRAGHSAYGVARQGTAHTVSRAAYTWSSDACPECG